MNLKQFYLPIVALLAGAFFQPQRGYAVASEGLVIVPDAGGGFQGRLAAKEIARYVYLRLGALPKMASKLPVQGDAIVLRREAGLEAEAFSIQTAQENGRRVWTIAGGSALGELYGAYRLAEKLGVRFYLHGDVIPDTRLEEMPEVNEKGAPLFAIRGILPFHDFPEGPDWWSGDDYLAYVSQLAKLRMNFLGLHCYPEGGVGPEALIWIGDQSDCDSQGRVRFSYPSFWANTAKEMWGCNPAKTSDFAGGASLLFAQDVYGNEAQAGLMPRPKTLQECNELFNRAGAMMGKVFAWAKSLGVKTCVGTETPLTIPAALKEHLKSRGKDPADGAVIGQMYEGIFARLAGSRRWIIIGYGRRRIGLGAAIIPNN